MSVQVMSSPLDSIRRWQTPEMSLKFPDTEEVTGSNPVRPTIFALALWLSWPYGLQGPDLRRATRLDSADLVG